MSATEQTRIRLSQTIKTEGQKLGFDIVRIARAVSPPGFHPLLKWIASGYDADMNWIARRKDAYRHPDGVLPDTRSVVVAALNYHNASGEHPPQSFRVSRYAWGTADYHSVMRSRLKALAQCIRHAQPDSRSRAVVDTAPLLERDFARIAGIGWFGKNTMLISPMIGSWFFVGAVLTTAELEYDESFDSEHCGTCTRCLDTCPTDAFPEPGVLNANRCISYLTIERRTKSVPDDLRSGMGNWIFGCDICQDVCPWNRFAPGQSLPEFHLREELRNIDLLQLLQMTDPDFQQLFSSTPLERTGRDVLVRNAAIAAGNQNIRTAVPILQKLQHDQSELVREAAAWALGVIEMTEPDNGVT